MTRVDQCGNAIFDGIFFVHSPIRTLYQRRFCQSGFVFLNSGQHYKGKLVDFGADDTAVQLLLTDMHTSSWQAQ